MARIVVPKLMSYHAPATDTAGVGYILTIPDAEERTVIVIVMEEVRVTRVLLLSVVVETLS